MKILLTVHQFLPEHSSGTEILTFETARSLVRMGHEVRILTGAYSPDALSDDQRFDQYRHEGLLVDRYWFSKGPIGGNTNQSELDYCNPLFAARFRLLLEAFRPDVVHAFHLMRLSALLVDECNAAGVPMVFTPTDFWFVCPQVQLLLTDHTPCGGPDADGANCLRHYMKMAGNTSRMLRIASHAPQRLLRGVMRRTQSASTPVRWLPARVRTLIQGAAALARRPAFLAERLNAMSRVMVPTRFMGRILSDHGLNPALAEYLPFGIDLNGLHRTARKPSTTFRIGYIGTLSPHKGAHVLIDAVRHLVPRDHDVSVSIFGKLTDFPDHVQWLKSLARQDERISFCGTFPNGRIGEIFSELDVLVVPSIWYENTPLVIYSAQACGVPVVASDFPGMSEAITDGDNGLLFKAEDWHGLAQCLNRLHDDRSFLATLAERARAPMSVDDYAGRLFAVYREVGGADLPTSLPSNAAGTTN